MRMIPCSYEVKALLLSVIIERHKASIERNVYDPILLFIRKHGETETLQLRVVVDERVERFCFDVNLRFYFNGYDAVVPLGKKVDLYR